jgi:hypothetical protein
MYTLYSVLLILKKINLYNPIVEWWIYPAIVWFWVLIDRSNKRKCYLVIVCFDNIFCRHIQHITSIIILENEYHINCLCTELSSLLCIQSFWWYTKGMINGHQGKMLFNMLYMYILIYWWNRLIFMTHLLLTIM